MRRAHRELAAARRSVPGHVKLERRGLEASRAILEATPVEPSLDDYVFNLHRLMGAEWALATEAGEEDSNHSRAAGIRTMLDEVEEFAATLGEPPEPPGASPEPDWTNLLTLFQSQLPLVRSLHANGSFGPLSAFMNTGGVICGEAIATASPDESLSATGAINRIIRRHLASLRQGSIQAGAVFFQAALSNDDGMAPDCSVRDPNAVIARLQNSAGAALQAVMRYRADTAHDRTMAWAYRRAALHGTASDARDRRRESRVDLGRTSRRLSVEQRATECRER